MMIRFTVPCVPVPQPRQRHRIAGAGHKQFVQNYVPAKHPVQAFKMAIRLAARQAYSGPQLEGPLALRVLFLMPRPGRLLWKKRPMPRLWHTIKPDAENILKALQDALSGCVWVDDCQIADVRAQKLYCSGSEQPSVLVEIDRLSDEVLAFGTSDVKSEYA